MRKQNLFTSAILMVSLATCLAGCGKKKTEVGVETTQPTVEVSQNNEDKSAVNTVSGNTVTGLENKEEVTEANSDEQTEAVVEEPVEADVEEVNNEDVSSSDTDEDVITEEPVAEDTTNDERGDDTYEPVKEDEDIEEEKVINNDAPATETPAVETPVAETPKVETPVIETPVTPAVEEKPVVTVSRQPVTVYIHDDKGNVIHTDTFMADLDQNGNAVSDCYYPGEWVPEGYPENCTYIITAYTFTPGGMDICDSKHSAKGHVNNGVINIYMSVIY